MYEWMNEWTYEWVEHVVEINNSITYNGVTLWMHFKRLSCYKTVDEISKHTKTS